MDFDFKHFITASLTLFAVIDMLGSVPVIISIKNKIKNVSNWKVTLATFVLMVGFLFFGEYFLKYLGVDRTSFAIAGSIVMFILGLEMVLGVDFFRTDPNVPSGSVVPVAFPIIAGSGTLTTILSLKTAYSDYEILAAIAANTLVIFFVMASTGYLEKKIGKATMAAMRKFFGVILLAIAVKIFKNNI